jgi:hypothetical protein
MSYANPRDHSHAPHPHQDTMCPGPFSVWWSAGCCYVCVRCGAIELTEQGEAAQRIGAFKTPTEDWILNHKTDAVIRELQGWRGEIFT